MTSGPEDGAAGTVRVGFLGCGTVGAEAVRILADRREAIARYSGVDVEVRRIAVRDLGADRGLAVAAGVLTDDPYSVVTADDVDLVVEVMGGTDPAGALVAKALERSKPVVTANKALMASEGPALLDKAEAANVDLLYEASVGGGIPIIRPLTETLAGEYVHRVMGIVNGTTNYILTRMDEEGADFGTVLADAQALGYAEAEPSADVDGHDAAQKAAILATLAFGTRVHDTDVPTEGIRGVHAHDLELGRRLGYVVKLLAIAEYDAGADAVLARVFPAMIPESHPLATVRLSYNAVFVEGESAGSLMFYGQGAGAGPTAMAVVGDVVDAARNLRQGARGPHVSRRHLHGMKDAADATSQFYVRLEVEDRPGVLAEIAQTFGDHGVSLKSVLQEGREDDAELVMVTHASREADVEKAVAGIGALGGVETVAAVLRVVADEVS